MKIINAQLLDTRRFLPLFSIQFLNAMSDQVLRTSIMVIISYQGLTLFGLTKAVSVSLVAVLFLCPFFIFSTYAGKIADYFSKTRLIQIIKYCEIVIVALAAIGAHWHNLHIMVVALILMGTHSTFFSPIKYSILPHYLKERSSLLLANGYIELGTFVAILFGQTLGSWYSAARRMDIVIAILIISNLCGLILSLRLDKVVANGNKPTVSWNVVRDFWQLYRQVTVNRIIRNNLHAISWFWAVGVIITTQLVMLTRNYMGGWSPCF